MFPMTRIDDAPRLDHAAIGNGRVLALVSPTAAIDWLCLPRFDSPSLFARLLDRERGGTFQILAAGGERAGTLAYLPNTNVARLVVDDGDAAWEVLDFAPRLPHGLDVTAPIELMRLVRPLRGAPRLRVRFDPQPDYARRDPGVRETASGLACDAGEATVHLASNVPAALLRSGAPFTLEKPSWFVLSWGPRDQPATLEEVLRSLDGTVAGWRVWSKTITLPTFAPALVLRSALCLKLHASTDTGAIIAAATTSIPEALGTPRTWDYRYCWLRDAAFTVEALRRLGHLTEGERFLEYLRNVIDAGPLQPLYGVDGRRDLEEVLLPHLAGFDGCGHVRIGNAASTQRQNDLMGEIVLCLDTLLGDPRVVHLQPAAWLPVLEGLVEEALRIAPEPDTGIWEFRSLLRPYTFSRAMCWAAAHRGAGLAARLGAPHLAERWARAAEREREIVLARGFSPARGFFTQALDGEHPDAANLLLPAIGLVDGTDPRFTATLDAYADRLVEHGLMLRYRNPDDFGETTSAFTICSFWWAEALALAGRLDEAIAVFERVAAFANPVGLFSEDIEPRSGRLLGNFPQAYTHVGLIHAAMTIGQMLEVRSGRVRAWVTP